MNSEVKFTIKQARKFRELTQRQVAEKMAIDVSTYGKYEKKPQAMSYEQGELFSKIVNLPIDMIIFFNDDSTLSREIA